MNVTAGLKCPQCANPRDIYRYCMNCGFDFADLVEPGSALTGGDASVAASLNSVPQPAQTADPKTADERTTASVDRPADNAHVLPPLTTNPTPPIVGGASASVMLGIAFAAICILLIIGAALVSVLGNDGRGPSSDASETANSAGPDDTDGSQSPATNQVSCWDGSAADALSDCTAPTGTVGLAWVFPSFDESGCTNKSVSGANPAKWACRVIAPGGGSVTIRYREHKSVASALAAYTREYGLDNQLEVRSPREDIERFVWRDSRADNNGVWMVSSMYAEHPWAVSVKGRSAAGVDSAFSRLVEFRNPRRMNGRLN